MYGEVHALVRLSSYEQHVLKTQETNALKSYLFVLFQEVIRVAEGIASEGLCAALSQAFDAVAEPARR